MPRDEYQDHLAELREDVLYMSEIVVDRLQMGLDSLGRKDEELAREVIDGDHEINQLYLDLEQDCIDLIALQQPVASDLRFIAASFKILTDLERVGDLAANLAAYSLTADRDVFPEVDVQAIGTAVAEMLEDAMAAYADADTEACYALAERDDVVDRRCTAANETVVRDLLSRNHTGDVDDEQLMRDVSRLLLTIRDLERVGDHAVNVASRTVYMVDTDTDLLY
ncbi:MAG: phosphate signaling complex protein PhoU [Haloferacaceae archaeon]